jgi:DNA invertase Pin-like site-specific DNA recombinase
MSELHALGTALFLHQQGLDTTTPAGKAMSQMLGVFAEFERSIIQERVRAGLQRAKREGKRLGRPWQLRINWPSESAQPPPDERAQDGCQSGAAQHQLHQCARNRAHRFESRWCWDQRYFAAAFILS